MVRLLQRGEPDMGGRQLWSRAVAAATCALMAIPVLVDLARSPRDRPFGYAAADTFYYLGVARTAIESGSISTDGVHATNGFHPLWQLATIAVYGVCHAFGQRDAALLWLILLSLACAVAALWILAQAFQRGCGRVPTLVATLPIGVYALLASYYWHVGPPDANGGLEGALPVYGTLYAHVNGMESSLTLLAFAVLVHTLLRYSGGTRASLGLKCGLACAFLSLSRLDHAAFTLTPLALWVLELLQPRGRRRFLVFAILGAMVPLIAYCGINLAYMGVALPVSGAAKSHFPLPYADQLQVALNMLTTPLSPFDPGLVFRILPIVVSILAAIAYVGILTRIRVGGRAVSLGLRSFASPLDLILLKMAPGVVLLGLYDLMFVDGIGHWYFPISTLFVSLSFISLVTGLREWVRPPRWLSPVALCAWSMLVVGLFLRFQFKPSYHQSYAKFYWETAPRVRQELGGKVPAFIEQDDGIIAYSLRVHSISGGGFLLDREASRALADRHLVDVAYHRGIRCIASFYYARHGNLRTPSDARDWAQSVMGQDLSAYAAKVVYDDPTFSIVELTANGGAG
jgi:hypothetical protein